jgi:hypothetical protein
MKGRLDVGGVIGKVWRIYVDQASVLMPAAAVVFVFTGVLLTVLVRAGSGLALLGELVALIATSLFSGMVVELVADVQDGKRDATPAQLVRAVAPVLGSLILVAVVAGILIVIGLFLLIVPGLILVTIWSVAIPVVVMEHPSGLRALGRSRELVRGNGWQAFGVIFVLYLVVVIISGVLDAAGNSAGTGAGIVVAVVVGILGAPFPALAQAVLYFELRSINEAQPAAGPVEPTGQEQGAPAEEQPSPPAEEQPSPPAAAQPSPPAEEPPSTYPTRQSAGEPPAASAGEPPRPLPGVPGEPPSNPFGEG